MHQMVQQEREQAVARHDLTSIGPLSHTLSCTLSFSLALSLSLFRSLPPSLARSLSHFLSHTHTLSLTLSLTHSCSCSIYLSITVSPPTHLLLSLHVSLSLFALNPVPGPGFRVGFRVWGVEFRSYIHTPRRQSSIGLPNPGPTILEG